MNCDHMEGEQSSSFLIYFRDMASSCRSKQRVRVIHTFRVYIGSLVMQADRVVQLTAGVPLEKEARGIHQGAVPDFRLPFASHVLGPLNWKGACMPSLT